jgi:two-component sensor histidine kinase
MDYSRALAWSEPQPTANDEERQLLARTSPLRRLPAWLGYAGTTLLVLAAGGVRYALDGRLLGYPFLLFAPAIILAAGLFGWRCGLYAALLSTALAAWFFLEPAGSLHSADPWQAGATALFLATMLAAVLVIKDLDTALAASARENGRLKEAHRKAKAAAQEQTVLLAELAHRMRNDLAMLAAVIELQRYATTDPSVRAVLAATAERVYVLGQLHARLGRHDRRTVVDSRVFLEGLADDLHTTMVGRRPVTLEVEAESHPLPSARAMVLGLIVHELVTNALKYAFPAERAGTVTVGFERDGEEFWLTVADDGIGMAGLAQETSLGHRLVRALARKLGGRFETEDGGDLGTVCLVHFPCFSGPPDPALALGRAP